MVIIVCYDISTLTEEGRKRYRHVSKLCARNGVRSQYSVYECHVESAEIAWFREELRRGIDPAEDSLQMYFINDHDFGRKEHHGVRRPVDLDEPLVF